MLYTRWTLAGISIGFLARPNGNFFFAPPSVVVTSFSLLFSDVLLDLPFLPPPKLSERRALDFAGEDSFLAVFFLSMPMLMLLVLQSLHSHSYQWSTKDFAVEVSVELCGWEVHHHHAHQLCVVF